MTDRKLKLVRKGRRKRPGLTARRPNQREQPEFKLVSGATLASELEQVIKTPGLTEAEAAEAARFKEMIAARAARQATLYRIIAKLEALDEISSAA
jgi:hypothetical protein